MGAALLFSGCSFNHIFSMSEFDLEAELEEKANDCLTVEQELMSLERETAEYFKELQAIRARGYAPEEYKHRDRALLMFESGIRYARNRLTELRNEYL